MDELKKENINAVLEYLLSAQKMIIDVFKEQDKTAELVTDNWERSEGGGGQTSILSDGEIFERAGVNSSNVYGSDLPPAATSQRPELVGRSFNAMGISIVTHPLNPYIPTSHANVRFFVAEKPGEASIWWFGGGFDLTPYYGFTEDAIHWHQTAKETCDAFGPDVYIHFKNWCDDYFYLKHRNEPRGIGGLFFDDLNEWGFDKTFKFLKAIVDAYIKAYMPIVKKRQTHAYSDREKKFQLYRRGRYVEFNLLYDRGTLFGLQSNGRTESILMSLPPEVRWQYGYSLEKGSAEEDLYKNFLVRKEWV